MYIYHNFFIHSSVDAHLPSFLKGAVGNVSHAHHRAQEKAGGSVAVGVFNLPKLFLEHLEGLEETPGGSLPPPHCGRSDIYCMYITNNHRKRF